MNGKLKVIVTILLAVTLTLGSCNRKKEVVEQDKALVNDSLFMEAYRPQFHFSPAEKWMNDPNGLVFHEGVYHLFYQYYPGDIVWGPMHWGHAVSKDLVYWEQKPIALFPDELGYIFSGSAIVDDQNTSGLGNGEKAPLAAIYTYHDMEGEKKGSNDYQTQGLAFSTDNGESWEKYSGNPILQNEEGFKDFRDPKVFWHESSKQWIMVLVAGDHARIYQSQNLIEWKYVSEFGKDRGGHGGVWECPDLFPLTAPESGKEVWVMIISINPGAPNGGSGTQYFIGKFDGTTFTSEQKNTRWLDWGTDNYAGVSYNHVPNGDRILIGWMSNWMYARDTPTETWRSAMTVPRKLGLQQQGDSLHLTNYPVENLATILKSEINRDISLPAGASDTINFDHFNQSEVRFRTEARDFVLSFGNDKGDTLMLTMDSEQKNFVLDRIKSGKVDFNEGFGDLMEMPVPGLPDGAYEVRVLMDWSSVEVFINGGVYVMTAQLFPNAPYTMLTVSNPASEPADLTDLEVSRAERIW